MSLSKPGLAIRMTMGCSALVLGMLLSASGWPEARQASALESAAPPRNVEYIHAMAGIYGRIHTLRHLEKEMLANAASPGKEAGIRQRREEAMQRINELVATADSAATTDRERRQLEQSLAWIDVAQARFAQVRAAMGSNYNSNFSQLNGDSR